MKHYLTKSSESEPPSKKNRVFGPPGPSDITQDTDSQPMQPVLVSVDAALAQYDEGAKRAYSSGRCTCQVGEREQALPRLCDKDCTHVC